MSRSAPETVTGKLSGLIAAAGVQHFTAAEVLTLGAAHASNGLNTLPPLSIVHQIMPTLVVVDSLRAHLKKPGDHPERIPLRRLQQSHWRCQSINAPAVSGSGHLGEESHSGEGLGNPQALERSGAMDRRAREI